MVMNPYNKDTIENYYLSYAAAVNRIICRAIKMNNRVRNIKIMLGWDGIILN